VTSEQSVETRFRWQTVGLYTVVLLVLLIVGFAIFVRTATYGYLPWDDAENITQNPWVNGGGRGLAKIWTHAYDGLYIPLVYTSWWLEKTLGLGPRASHIANIVLHVLTAWSVFLLALQLLAPVLSERLKSVAASAAALLFLLHPLQVEAVAWATGRKDLLAGLFAVFTALCYLHWSHGGKRVVLAASYVFFLFALLSKPSVAPLPFALMVLDWSSRRKLAGVRVVALVGLLVLAVLGVGANVLAQRSASTNAPSPLPDVEVPITQRPLVAGGALAFYFEKTVWPRALSPVYDINFTEPGRVAAWVALAFILTLAMFFALKRSRPAALILGAILLLLPASGIIPFHYQAISFVADRYMYLPLALLAVAAACVLGSLDQWKRPAGVAALCAGAVLLVGFASVSYRQCGYWRDSLSLWTRAVAVAPGNAIAQSNLAMSLGELGHSDEALPHLETAVEINPKFAIAHNNLGAIYSQRGDQPKAVEHYEAAAAANPKFAPAQSALAAIYFQQQRAADAEKAARAAVASQPDDFISLAVLASVLGGQGHVDEALTLVRDAARRNPGDARFQELLKKAEAAGAPR
jgi:tetratricopeptide (TPR) repeat protein